jgi:gas vesicle protein
MWWQALGVVVGVAVVVVFAIRVGPDLRELCRDDRDDEEGDHQRNGRPWY